jgi:hypothetical protein
MLSEGVLNRRLSLSHEDIKLVSGQNSDKIHKLYRLVAYQRCSRWVFQIWGNKNRKPLSILRVFTQ